MTDDKPAALLRRSAFNQAVSIDRVGEQFTNLLVLLSLQERFALGTGWVGSRDETVDRIKQGISKVGPRFGGAVGGDGPNSCSASSYGK